MKLNLGSGDWPVDGYENIDRKNGKEVYPLPYEDNSIDEVRASHILEHFSHTKTLKVLAEWVRVLKPGGLIRIAVPNFRWIAEKYLAGEEHKYDGYLFGGHVDEDDKHEACFEPNGLRYAMETVGLVEIEPWTSEIDDCSKLPVSLNLQGRKNEAKSPEDEDYAWLAEFASNTYSQNGEDGILQKVFEKIGTTNKHVIECGAGDPIQFSNSRKLIEEGWAATLIEKDDEKARKLVKAYPPDRVRVYGAEAKSLDNWTRNASEAPDLLVLDVDGQEYYLWNSCIRLKPRVVLCEYDPTAQPDFIPEINGKGQAGRDAIINLANGKGYSLIGQINVNLLFVQRGLESLLNAATGFVDFTRIGKEVRGCLSTGRLGFNDTFVSVMTALVPLGIQLEINTGVYWGQAHTKMMEAHIDEPELRYFLTLDFDTIFTQKDVLELYRLMETHPEVDVLATLQMRREGETPLLTVMSKAGHNLQEISTAELDAEIMPINSAHFGLTMIRVSSLRKAKKPWFLHVPDSKGEWGPDHMDEDVYFWHNLKESGLKAYQANKVTIGHAQLMITWPGQDLKPVHCYLKDWYSDGKPKGAR